MKWTTLLLAALFFGSGSERAYTEDWLPKSSLDPVAGKLLREGNPTDDFVIAHCLTRHPENQECTSARIADCNEYGCRLYLHTYSTPDQVTPERRRSVRQAAERAAFKPGYYLTQADLAALLVALAFREENPVLAAILVPVAGVLPPVCLAADTFALPFEAMGTLASYKIQKDRLIRSLAFLLDSSQEEQSALLSDRRYEKLQKELGYLDQTQGVMQGVSR